MALQDKIDKIQADLTSLTDEVTAAIADIAALKAQIGSAGETVTQAELDALDAISTKLEGATADLKAGE